MTIDPNAPMFTQNDIAAGKMPLVRAVRTFFSQEGITNDQYIHRHRTRTQEKIPGRTKQEYNQKCAADRKFLMDERVITPNMTKNILDAMGYDVETLDRDDKTATLTVINRDSKQPITIQITM